MKKILIIGSNFGSKIYLKIIKKIYEKSIIHICSPNIKGKKLFGKNIYKYNNFNLLIKINDYDLIICATTPRVQYKFLKKFIPLKKKSTKLMLEKPLTHNYKSSDEIYKLLIKNKFIFNQNFVFPKITNWLTFYNNLKKFNLKKISYDWEFEQAYFKNKIKTWKIRNKDGGGMIQFYLPHIIYNLLLIDEKIKIKKVIYIDKFNKILTAINFLIASKNTICSVKMNIKSKEKLHHIAFYNQKNYIDLKNTSIDWTKNCKFSSNLRTPNNTSQDGREKLTQINLEDLFSFNYNSKLYLKKLRLFKKTYILLNKIQGMTDAY